MGAIQRVAGITVFGLTSAGCAVGACAQGGGLPDFSTPQGWALVIAAAGSGIASGLQIKGLFEERAATRRDVQADGGKTRFQLAEGPGDLHQKVDRQTALMEALLARDVGRGAGADAMVETQVSAVADSDDPGVRAAVDTVVVSGGAQGLPAAEAALLAAAPGGG